MFLWDLLATALFFAGFACLVLRWLSCSGLRLPSPFSDLMPVRAGASPDRAGLVKVFAAALGFRVAAALASLLLYNLLSGESLGLSQLPQLWARWDAPHYIHLVEQGYAGYLEEGQPLFLVFFPLYVWLVRAVNPLFPQTALAGMTVSALCFAWGCVFLYRLASEEYGPTAARRSLLLLWAFPFSFFYGGIMTESLFFLTTTAGLYRIRRHQWGRAALWGILAAMTRMQGVLLMGAAGAELFCAYTPFRLRGGERKRAIQEMAKRLPLLAAPMLGSLVYFGLNRLVTGDPFAFLQMQRHWSQGFLWFPRVLAYLLDNALTWPNVTTRWEMWIPELLLFPIFALLLLRSWKKHRSMFTLYGTVYFILTYCLSWLLSAGRYLACGIPCFLFAAEELEAKPKRTALLIGGMGILQCLFCYRYLCWGQVM